MTNALPTKCHMGTKFEHDDQQIVNLDLIISNNYVKALVLIFLTFRKKMPIFKL